MKWEVNTEQDRRKRRGKIATTGVKKCVLNVVNFMISTYLKTLFYLPFKYEN